MRKLITKFLILHTIIIVVAGVGIGWIIESFFPTLMVKDYLYVPIFFYLMGILFILHFRKSAFARPAKMVNIYMLMKVIKIFISFGIIIVYWSMHKTNIRSFAIIFIVFYLIDLLWETIIYLRMEQFIKRMSDQNNLPKKPEHHAK